MLSGYLLNLNVQIAELRKEVQEEQAKSHMLQAENNFLKNQLAISKTQNHLYVHIVEEHGQG